MKSVLIYPLVMLLLLYGSVSAQEENDVSDTSRFDEYMETGSEISGVRVPYYDEEGNLRAQLFGGHAKILAGGAAQVTDIRIEVFDEGRLFMTVYAPACVTKMIEQENGKKMLSVESDGDVLIEMDQMTITGKGFRFTSDRNRFEILSESRVLVKETAKTVKGLEL